MTPLYDYQDTQTSGWGFEVVVYLDTEFNCYPVEILPVIQSAVVAVDGMTIELPFITSTSLNITLEDLVTPIAESSEGIPHPDSGSM